MNEISNISGIMSMLDSHKHLLTKNRVRLIRDLIPNEEFFAVLMGDHTLTPSMVEDIQAAKTTQGKVGKLLDILPKRGAKAFQTFLNALRESHQGHLLDVLDPSGAASSQRSSGVVISQSVNDPRLDRFSPSDTSSSRNAENLKHPKQASVGPSENAKQTSVQPSENFERKPVQPVDSVKLSGEVLDEIVHLVGKLVGKEFNFLDFNSSDLQCVDGSEANREQKLLMSRGQGAIVKMGRPQTMSFDDINLVEAFKKFGFDIKTQSCEDLVASLEKEEASAAIVFVFASHSPGDGVAEQISRITEILKNSAVLRGKPKVLIHQTTAEGVPSGDQMDSVRDDVTRQMSNLGLDGFDDNMAVLGVSISKKQQIRWLVCSLVALLMKHSKTMDVATMLKHVRDVLDSQNISVQLESSLKEGLFFSAKS